MNNYYHSKEYWRKRKIAENQVKKLAPNLKPKETGIYTWFRVKEYAVYCGQSVDILERTLSHLFAYDHLGNSVRNHGIYSKDNPTGWRFTYFTCDKDKLDQLEREEIAKYQKLGCDMLNITSGGQNEGKVDINQRQASKGYQEGLHKGYEKCKKEIKELFEKYLVAEIKEKPNKIKERKLKEFKEWLNGEEIKS